jgi:DNA-binding transcriptional ArsR family regulator
MFKVSFEYREDEEYGGEGWIPKAYPMFNAATGFGLVHDVLEHFPNDEPDLAGEMKAFGSMINVRWMSGWIPYKGHNMHSPESNMGSDIANFLRDIHNGSDTRHFATPPRTHKLDEEIEDMIAGALVEGTRLYKLELSYDEEANPMSLGELNTILEKMRGWMRVGYRQSVKRYHNAEHYDLSVLFSQIERKVYRLNGEFGQELVIAVSPKNLTFKVEVLEPNYDY